MNPFLFGLWLVFAGMVGAVIGHYLGFIGLPISFCFGYFGTAIVLKYLDF